MLVLHHMKGMITELAREEISSYLSDPNSSAIPHDVAIEFAVNTLITLIHWWMDDKKMAGSAKEVDRMFHQLTLSGVGIKDGVLLG